MSVKGVKLTDNPLTNIIIMTPMLSNKQKEAMYYVMLGCILGGEIATGEGKNGVENV